MELRNSGSHVRRCLRPSFCGGCYSNVRGRSNIPGHRAYHARKPTPFYVLENQMKRRAQEAQKAKGKWTCPDPQFAKQFPALAQDMFDVFWEDGKTREPSTLTVRGRGDAFSISLNDPEAKASVTTTGETLMDTLTLLDAALAAGTAKWWPWKGRK